MSKYIRTKDAVYDLEDDSKHEIIEIDGKYNYVYVDEDTEDTCFIELKIIAKSDTIEELCDEFVVIQKDSKPYRPSLIYGVDIKKFYTENKHNNCEVYGTIWTDKGLIYVAKMNEDGELVLI